jgi:type IV secretory pathway VirB6-like protein
MRTLRTWFTILLASWALILMPSQAMAYELLSCDDNGNVAGGQLFLTTAGQSESFCEFQGLDHIFSQVACDVTTVLNIVLGAMYCALQYNLAPVVAALLTLYIVVFGVQLLMGTAELTSKEILLRLFKIALVWTFVTQSAWGIGIVFLFFIDLANQLIWWSMSAIDTGGLINMPPLPTGGVSTAMPVYHYIDKMILDVVTGPLTQANSKLVGFFALMAGIIPPIFAIAVYWLVTTFKILMRALISFLLSISALAFLISLSPIFLSFMLFKATAQFFESWLKFMISYALQMGVVFACIATWAISVNMFVGFFDELSNVIFIHAVAGHLPLPHHAAADNFHAAHTLL